MLRESVELVTIPPVSECVSNRDFISRNEVVAPKLKKCRRCGGRRNDRGRTSDGKWRTPRDGRQHQTDMQLSSI
jgi:hypothetical protein